MADTLRGGIVINEMLVDPNGGAFNFDADGNGTAAATDEFVELANISNTPIDIGGLELWDAGVGKWFTFPAGTILQPGAHALVMTGLQPGGSLPQGGPNDLAFDAGRGSALINNGGDNAVVYDPVADAYIQATFNGDALDDPPTQYPGFSSTATRVGAGEDMGNDTDGQSVQRYNDTADTFVTGTPTPADHNICFVVGTLIATPDGQRKVEELRPGDLVCTIDHGAQPVIWAWSTQLSVKAMCDDPRQAPLRIAAGAFGAGFPRRDLWVSRQHRVIMAGPIVRRMYGVDEVLVAAHRLTALPGIVAETPAKPVNYVHILLRRHEILLAEGLPVESLYLGDEARAAIPLRDRMEIQKRLGSPLDTCWQPARPLAEGRRAKNLVMRHLVNRKMPVCV
ncbi:lamin tail-like protein [Albidovulum inexpectatum]|uniref:Lamin tail-like protein n=1 Tax=Albidovulum inexpectatum TaxID=196587 RepID=A0A2S5JEU8_9RHOB|nr:Hint domain-containing protein [Albidovulum inexpectatum]PPB80036.1 lamin tail-like protein [Albidovulum inexpectatum]